MKKSQLLLTIIFMLTLVSFSTIVRAQTPGPSETTTPPATATDPGLSKVYCAGSTIKLTGPQDATQTPVADYAHYHWYKMAVVAGVLTPVEVTSQTTSVYTETSTTAGWYEYELVTENANGCLSPVSTMLKVYVLPTLSVTISTTAASLCQNSATAPTLTANATPATPYTLHYQWTKTIGAGSPTNVGTDSPTYTIPAADDATAQTI